MTDELNRLSSDREETDRGDSLPTGADAVTAVVEHTMDNNLPSVVTFELIPDWLKPMEEDDDAVEGDKIMERSNKKTIPNILRKKRGRGRPPLAKTVRARLNMIKAQGGAVQKMSVDTNDGKRSTGRIPKRRMATPIRPQQTPTLPTGSITIFSSPVFCSPPPLTRVSPLDVERTQIPCHSPSLQLSSVSQQINPATLGNNGTEMPIHIWQCPPLQPISPPKTPEAFVDQTVTIGSPDSPDADLNESEPEKEEILLLMRDCVGCGGPFPAEKVGDTLCHKCKPAEKKHSPPNIVFRKVGQDQWEVGKTKPPKKLKAAPKCKKVIKKDVVPDGGGDDDCDEDDELNWMYRKRSKNRRMCRSCEACLRKTDCGVCDFCMDKPKFGGSNKKRQKCRLRQCQLQSRLHHQVPRVLRSPRRRQMIKLKLKQGKTGKRRNRKDPWDFDGEDYGSDKEDETKLKHFNTKDIRKRQKKKWNYSFEDEEEEMFIEALIDDDEPDESDSLSVVRNEPMKIVMDNNGGFNVNQPPQSQEIYYTLPGVPEASRMLSPVTLCTPNDAGGVASPLPAGITPNDILQIEMVRVGSPVSELTEPQNTAQPEQQGYLPEHTPVITQIFSLAIGTECDFDRDSGLMELFHSLRQTVLPAHWVGVMAKGPILQLLQCSKLSTMADTVIQIEKGFFYQISVQNQPLLLMHSVYMRHPTCLTSVGEVVSLLLDLEGLSVCQGHQNFNPGTPWEPRMCVRAALCDLLIPKDEEQCEKCAHPAEV